MRTAIYVHAPDTVKIHNQDPGDAGVTLARYGQIARLPAIGSHALAAGIYLVVSRGPLDVVGNNITVEIVTNNKDEWPDPTPGVIALVPGATARSVREFFTVAKDLSIDG